MEWSEVAAAYRAEVDVAERLVAAAEEAELWRQAREHWTELHDLAEQWDAARRRKRYAAARVRSLETDMEPRVAGCGVAERWIRCACEGGDARPVKFECRQRSVCEPCRKRWASRQRQRMIEAIPGWTAKHRDQRNRAGRVRMITLTVAHSGQLAADRAELVRGWTGLRKQMHKWFGGALPYVLVWETTPGKDGLGHEHAHVIVVGGPPHWNYAAMQRTWRNVCPRSSHLDIQLARGDTARAAGMYLGKYASKGAEIGGFGWTDELIAQWIAAHYNQRGVSTSRGFWVPPEPICARCGEWVHRAEAPNPWVRQIDTREGELCRIRGERGPPGAKVADT